MNSTYLPLTEYSSKYKVSISTLRRRIKAKDIKFRFDQGKYFIYDQEPQRPSLETVAEIAAVDHRPSLKAEIKTEAKMASEKIEKTEKNDEPIITAANRLLTELKKAYTQILQEKEEQVMRLKEEVSDLKTLVKVLESENERLGSNKINLPLNYFND